MKVLWIAPNGGKYRDDLITGTGGWIVSMQQAIEQYQPDLELGICFMCLNHKHGKKVDGNITYLPIEYRTGRNNLAKIYYRYFRNPETYTSSVIDNIERVIDEFKPNIVHVWGT